MRKIWLVTKREYITRVKNKTFVLTTILAPLGILILILVVGIIFRTGSDSIKTIAVADAENLLQESLSGRENLQFFYTDKSMETLYEEYTLGLYDGILEILPLESVETKKYTIQYHSDKALAIDEQFSIKDAIGKKVRNYKLLQLNIDASNLEKLNTEIVFEPISITSDKKMSSVTTIVGSVLGGIVGYLMFFIIVMYGTQVMRSVTEEKTNRIVEILISTVKPFQLMMGKVIGVGFVGLTQIAIWIVIIPIILLIGVQFMGLNESQLQDMNTLSAEQMDNSKEMMVQVLQELKTINWFKLISITLF